MSTGPHASSFRTGACIACHRELCRFLPRDTRTRPPKGIALERGGRLQAPQGACLRFWTLKSGTAAICSAFQDGRRQILGLELAGDTVCGLMSMGDSAIWLEALEECVICEVDFSHRADVLQADAAFVSAIFGVTHQRLESFSHHVATLGRLDSTERVILFLADMARRTEGLNGAGGHVALPMSREDIADYLGLNSETVSRVMSRIKKTGLVKFLSPTEYTVPDFKAIERRLPIRIPVRRPPVGRVLLRAVGGDIIAEGGE